MPVKSNTTKVGQEHFYLSIPITKFDEEQRIVEGVATAEVLDSQGDIVDFDSACKAFDTWEGNVREQHDKLKAVGRAVSFTPDADKRLINLSARISKGAQDTWEKVKDGTLRYFSIGSPFGSYERKPEVVKVGDVDKRANRLFLNALSEVSLVDQGSCSVAKIGLWKMEDGASDVLEAEEPAAAATPAAEPSPAGALPFNVLKADDARKLGLVVPEGVEVVKLFGAKAIDVEKLTEGAGSYADPGWQADGNKRYPLDTEAHVKAASSYFGRPRNRKKYTAEQVKKIDAKIDLAKKKFKIGEYAEKSDGTMDLCKCGDGGQFVPLSWVSMFDYKSVDGLAATMYVPRTFGKVWEDTEDADIFPIMGHMFGKVVANILASKLSGEQQRALIQQSVDELMEELDDEFMEASEESAELTADTQKFVAPQLTKAGARNSKSDLAKIQTMHDHCVALGATCKPAGKDDKEKSMTTALEKVQGLVLLVDDLAGKLQGLDVAKAVIGSEVAKIADALAPVITEMVQKGLATKASKEEVATIAAAAAAAAGDIAKANEAAEGVNKRLEIVEKGPAVSLPVTRPAPGMAVGEGTAEGINKLADEIAVLTKMQAESGDPLVREAIGKELFIKKMKAGPPAQ